MKMLIGSIWAALAAMWRLEATETRSDEADGLAFRAEATARVFERAWDKGRIYLPGPCFVPSLATLRRWWRTRNGASTASH